MNGKTLAQDFNKFAGAYHLVHNQHGSMSFEGYSPDGKQNYICERCGQSLMNVYVFTNDKNEYMHVGIDCAEKMGVPLSELRSAKTFYAREESRKNELTRKSIQEKFITANREKFANEITFLESLLIDTPINDFERNVIQQEISSLEQDVDSGKGKDFLLGILSRLTLVKTSVKIDKVKITGTLRAYRNCVILQGFYGATFINFLTDGINSYVYKGSAYGLFLNDTITAGWNVVGDDTRDGLLSTVINRPSKVVVIRDK